MVHHSPWVWVGFNAFVIFLLFLDLKVFHRRSHKIEIKEALIGSAFWILLALLFCAGIYYFQGHESGFQFLTGYLIEKSLSVDNLFVFLVIFSHFKVAEQYQHKILFWGILGALVMRAIFIFAGVALIHRFHWLMYLFGVFLIFTGYKLIFGKEKEMSPEKSPFFKIARKIFPLSADYEGGKFFTRHANRKGLLATPLLIVLIMIEGTDVMFALDSIPAILSISRDPFIVYTSNIFAILGLRALYFALAGLMGMFRYLNYGLGIILAFVGVKMLIADIYHVPVAIALGFIMAVLAISIILSMKIKPEKNAH